MNPEIAKLSVYAEGRKLLEIPLLRPILVGRQRTGDPSPVCHIPGSLEDRLVVAPRSDSKVSREHLRLESLDNGQVKVTNASAVRTLSLEPGGELIPGRSRSIDTSCRFQLSAITIRLDLPVEAGDAQFEYVGSPTLPPRVADGQLAPVSGSLMDTLASDFDTDQGNVLLVWLRTTTRVFESAASSPQFLSQAAIAVTQIVGLDYSMVLTYTSDNGWKVEATEGDETRQPRLSTRLLNQLLTEKRTVIMHPQLDLARGSLESIEAVVGSPILDEQGNLVGAVYATRAVRADSLTRQISKLEASLVELIAAGVAAGWARLKYEQQAMKSRVQFEQFFGPELANRLESDPTLLEGRDAHVTSVFCDITGFSAITEQLTSSMTLEWINETLDALSECVIQENGTLVDYIGDEVLAIWGAPLRLSDHALRACRAALKMRQRAQEVSQQWASRLGRSFDVRIGINSGVARVGNIGSKWKFKYGPLGNSINIASRVQGAAKQFASFVVATGATVELLDGELATRRIGRVQTVNIVEPIDLFVLERDPTPAWREAARLHEDALASYEQGDYEAAVAAANNLVQEFPDDGLGAVLLDFANKALQAPEAASPVWVLDTK